MNSKIKITKARIDQITKLIAKLQARDDFFDRPSTGSRSAGVCLVAKLRLERLSCRYFRLVEKTLMGVVNV